MKGLFRGVGRNGETPLGSQQRDGVTNPRSEEAKGGNLVNELGESYSQGCRATNRNCSFRWRCHNHIINSLISLSSFPLLSCQCLLWPNSPETVRQGSPGETVSRSQSQDTRQGREAWRMEVRPRVASPGLLCSSWTLLCGGAERWWQCLSFKAVPDARTPFLTLPDLVILSERLSPVLESRPSLASLVLRDYHINHSVIWHYSLHGFISPGDSSS